tara:strand:+ start:27 stop:839 length:813 start_codon:yes stop_codon:yes gene_type:complete
MSVSASDIVVYGSGTMPTADTGTSGGAIDLATKIMTADISSTDNVEILSTASADTGKAVVVTGRIASGAIVPETITTDGSNGTTVVDGSTQFTTILSVTFPAHAGTITVRKDGAGGDIAVAEGSGTTATGTTVTRVHRLFYDATANPTSGDDKVFYEKVFVRNNNSTNALLNATITGAETSTTILNFDLEDEDNGNNTSTNRLTAPTGSDMLGGSFTADDAEKAVHETDGGGAGDLAAGSAIGVWLQLTLEDGLAAGDTTYTLTTAGSTT